MQNSHFISDLHLGHTNVIKQDNRPFNSIDEHDSCILSGLSELPVGDELWVLGDVAFKKEALAKFFEATSHLQVFLVRGNHDDKLAWKQRASFHTAYEATYIRRALGYETLRLYLSHYSHQTWRNSCHGSYHLFGHSHGDLKPVGRSMDVGANVIGYKPISLKSVHELLSQVQFTTHHPKENHE